MKYIFLLLVLLNITYTKELPDFIKEWQGVYETSITQDGKTVKQAFQVSNNCFRDDKEGMENLYAKLVILKMEANLMIGKLIFTQKSQMI